jgi:hypothetical protein
MFAVPVSGGLSLLLGQKHLPEIIEGKSSSKERNWALNILTTSKPEAKGNDLDWQLGRLRDSQHTQIRKFVTVNTWTDFNILLFLL